MGWKICCLLVNCWKFCQSNSIYGYHLGLSTILYFGYHNVLKNCQEECLINAFFLIFTFLVILYYRRTIIPNQPPSDHCAAWQFNHRQPHPNLHLKEVKSMKPSSSMTSWQGSIKYNWNIYFYSAYKALIAHN